MNNTIFGAFTGTFVLLCTYLIFDTISNPNLMALLILHNLVFMVFSAWSWSVERIRLERLKRYYGLSYRTYGENV